MAESPEARKARYKRHKARMAADPEYAAEFRARAEAANKRYIDRLTSNTKEGEQLRANRKTTKYKFASKFKRDGEGPVKKGKPGRIVSLCGWMGW